MFIFMCLNKNLNGNQTENVMRIDPIEINNVNLVRYFHMDRTKQNQRECETNEKNWFSIKTGKMWDFDPKKMHNN